MKRKAKTAFVEDVDPTTEEVIEGTLTSASISLPAEESRQRRKVWRTSGEHLYKCRDSKYLGSLLEVLSQNSGDQQEVLTIIAGKNDDNNDVHKLFEEASQKSTRKHRMFYLDDNIINGESKTHIEREIPVDKSWDPSEDSNKDPTIMIAQRKQSARGAIHLQAHTLYFGQRLDLDRPYIFGALGDEIPGVGCPDLHITFRGVRDWDTVLKKGNFAGFDRSVDVVVSKDDVRAGKRVAYDFERACVVDGDVKPGFGIAVDAAQFRIFEHGRDGFSGAGEEAYSRPSGEKAERAGNVVGGKKKEFVVKLIGVGPEIVGCDFRADINVRFVLES